MVLDPVLRKKAGSAWCVESRSKAIIDRVISYFFRMRCFPGFTLGCSLGMAAPTFAKASVDRLLARHSLGDGGRTLRYKTLSFKVTGIVSTVALRAMADKSHG